MQRKSIASGKADFPNPVFFKVVTYVCLSVCLSDNNTWINPLTDLSHFDLGTLKNHGNVLSLDSLKDKV